MCIVIYDIHLVYLYISVSLCSRCLASVWTCEAFPPLLYCLCVCRSGLCIFVCIYISVSLYFRCFFFGQCLNIVKHFHPCYIVCVYAEVVYVFSCVYIFPCHYISGAFFWPVSKHCEAFPPLLYCLCVCRSSLCIFVCICRIRISNPSELEVLMDISVRISNPDGLEFLIRHIYISVSLCSRC